MKENGIQSNTNGSDDSPLRHGLLERLSHQFLGWYTTSFLLWNWKMVYYLAFSEAPAEERLLNYTRHHHFGDCSSDNWYLQILWFALSLIWSTAIPVLLAWFVPVAADNLLAMGKGFRLELTRSLRDAQIEEAEATYEQKMMLSEIEKGQGRSGRVYLELKDKYRDLEVSLGDAQIRIKELESQLTSNKEERQKLASESELYSEAFVELSQFVLEVGERAIKDGRLNMVNKPELIRVGESLANGFISGKPYEAFIKSCQTEKLRDKWKLKPRIV